MEGREDKREDWGASAKMGLFRFPREKKFNDWSHYFIYLFIF